MRGNHSLVFELNGAGRRTGDDHRFDASRSTRQRSISFRCTPSVVRFEMKYNVPPSAVKNGSASTPSPANGAGTGSDHPSAAQRLTRIRQPSKRGELRTKYRSPVRGSNAACDSNCAVEIRAIFHGTTVAFAAAVNTIATRSGRMNQE